MAPRPTRPQTSDGRHPQNRKTLNFLGATAGWTPNHDEARIFSTGLEAMLFCLNNRVADMQILGKFADQRMDFTVPVTNLREG